MLTILEAHRLDEPVRLLCSALSGVDAAVIAWDAAGSFHAAGGDQAILDGLPAFTGRCVGQLLADPVSRPVAEVLRAVLDGRAEAPASPVDEAGRMRVLAIEVDGSLAGAALVVRPGRQAAEHETVRLSAALERTEQDLRHFAHVTSHDLSEPLRVMSGYAEMLGRRYDDRLDDRGRRYVASIVAGAARMHALLEALLAYSRTRSTSPACQTTNLDTVLGETLAGLERSLRERNAVVTCDALPTVTADPRGMAQVLGELVANAIKFSDDPPRVHVGAHERAEAWEVSVSDQGIGIDPSQHDRAFELLQRLNARDAYPGTGTGLTLAREIVRAHGGEMWVRSAPSTGSTFAFSLPKSPPSGAAHPTRAPREQS